jgi:hypothetical protein
VKIIYAVLVVVVLDAVVVFKVATLKLFCTVGEELMNDRKIKIEITKKYCAVFIFFFF